MLQTEFAFSLPRGYVDGDGTLHRDGVMRLATAFDELAPLKDPRVQANPAYLLVILLSRVVTRLGGLDTVNPRTIETLYAADLQHLQELYRRINETGSDRVRAHCPHCERDFDVALDRVGESGAAP